MPKRIGFPCVLAALALAACGEPRDCFKMKSAQPIVLAVRELLPPADATPSCGSDFDFWVGDELTLRIDGFALDTRANCKQAFAHVVSDIGLHAVDGVPRPEPATMTTPGGVVIDSRTLIDRDGCPGTWSLRVVARPDSTVDAAYEPGNPPLTLYRLFVPESEYVATDAAACAAYPRCVDAFGVEFLVGAG